MLLCYRFWDKSNSLKDIKRWLTKENLNRWFTSDTNCDCKILENKFDEGYGKIEVRCGNLKCKFELKTFSYMYEVEKGTFV